MEITLGGMPHIAIKTFPISNAQVSSSMKLSQRISALFQSAKNPMKN